MMFLTIGLRGPTGYLRTDSQPLEEADADAQYTEVADRIADSGLVRLPWLAVRGPDVLLVKLTRLA